jgi:hypothetical protein
LVLSVAALSPVLFRAEPQSKAVVKLDVRAAG